MEFEESTSAPLEQLDLFRLRPTQNAVDKVHWIEYTPIGQNVDNSPIDFVIPGNGSDYIDLNRSMICPRKTIDLS